MPVQDNQDGFRISAAFSHVSQLWCPAFLFVRCGLLSVLHATGSPSLSLFLPLSLSLYHKLVTVRFERDGGERVQLGTADPRSWVLGSHGLPPPTCQQGAAVGEYAMPQGLGADLIHVGFCFRVLAEFWEACWCRVG